MIRGDRYSLCEVIFFNITPSPEEGPIKLKVEIRKRSDGIFIPDVYRLETFRLLPRFSNKKMEEFEYELYVKDDHFSFIGEFVSIEDAISEVESRLSKLYLN